ncbi:hypothetical protein [Vibrio fluvialis]|uniref:hypothetical protein n=1 Tax=Vibrio fluvialis TaxID=676 RepID=UPI001F283678|nr:hypothetical protein [Vibrio fluvialis]EKO3371272.1 hypothetical protein [Vibrio fluvialis]ELE5026022.1 hypothetical protein [Vibrio fluvialis]ELL4669281.1 hypothetical protein [Vibrio fluvialis]MCE7610971.1 hypothetical protein [Vibrio fluvialis]MCE7620880.1 hypothetical protein [Vibrio fluvialis]
MWQSSSLTWPQTATGIQSHADVVTKQVGQTMTDAASRLANLQSDANFGRHALSIEAEALLGLRAELDSLLNTCTVVTVTPYQFQVGEKLDSGSYLSPNNAVKTLSAKLRDLSDRYRPNGQLHAVAIMLTGQSISEFAAKLEQIIAVLTLPDWTQVARQAKAMVTNERDKLHQPVAMVQPRFKPFATLNAQPLGDYFSEQSAQLATLESLASDSTHVIGKLQALAAKRSAVLSDISEAINNLKNLQGSVYSMSLSGSAESIATQLQNTAAPNNHQLTIASLLLSHEPLTYWEELLCSP